MITLPLALLAILMAELFFRFHVSKKKYRAPYHQLKWRKIFQRDPLLSYVPKPCVHVIRTPNTPPNKLRTIERLEFKTNAFGFYSPRCERSYDANTIFCVGDSITVGSESNFEQTYPSLLDASQSGQGCRFVNAAVGGYRSIHFPALVESRVLPLRPDRILLLCGILDYEFWLTGSCAGTEESVHEHYFSRHFSPNPILDMLMGSALMHFTINAIRSTRKTTPRRDLGPWQPTFQENISKIVRLCRGHGVNLVLVTLPSPAILGADKETMLQAKQDLGIPLELYPGYAQATSAINAFLRKTAQENDLDVVDASRFFEQVGSQTNTTSPSRFHSLFLDRCHLSASGHHAMAEAVQESMNSWR